MSFEIREGATDEHTLAFTTTGTADGVSVEVSTEMAPALQADAERIIQTAENAYELPVDVLGPVDATAPYVGTISLRDASGVIGAPLAVTVTVVRTDSSTVPERVAAPVAERVVTADGYPVVKDELLVAVSFDVADPTAVIRAAAGTVGARILGAIPSARLYQLYFPGVDYPDLAAKVAALQAVAGVEYASRNLAANEADRLPDDSVWDDGRTDDRWGLERINAPTAWDTVTGSNTVKVGVVDTDFDRKHGDLDDNIGHTEARGDEDGGHGTHTSGTICAEGDNDKGMTGVAWDCELRQYPFGETLAESAESMQRTVDDGARVVNMSFGLRQPACPAPGTPAMRQAVLDANRIYGRAILYAQRAGKDVLWAASAGNSCRDVEFASPASLVKDFPTNVITVASIDTDGRLSDFSNHGELVTIAAPGRDVYSAVPRRCRFFGRFCDDQYERLSGTSMAAPHVTGVAALLFSHKPELTAAEAKTCIVGGAITAGRQVPDRDFYELDAAAAIACEGTVALPPVVDVVFALDLTGSMGGVLDLAKQQVGQAIIDMRTVAPTTDFQFAVTSYEDYPGSLDSTPCGSSYSARYGVSTDEPFRVDQRLSSDGDAVAAAVNGLSLGNGSDNPESYGRALWEIGQPDTGATLGFRPEALRLVINFGDNIPHDSNINDGVESPPLGADTGVDPGRNGIIDCGGDDIDFQTHAIATMAAADIRLLHVDSSAGTAMEPYWRLWTSQTGGAYTRLTRDDGRSLSEITLELLRLLPDA